MRDQLYEYVVSGLKRRKNEWPAIAQATGLSTKTMSRMVAGDANSRRDTLILLAEHFEAHPAQTARSR